MYRRVAGVRVWPPAFDEDLVRQAKDRKRSEDAKGAVGDFEVRARMMAFYRGASFGIEDQRRSGRDFPMDFGWEIGMAEGAFDDGRFVFRACHESCVDRQFETLREVPDPTHVSFCPLGVHGFVKEQGDQTTRELRRQGEMVFSSRRTSGRSEIDRRDKAFGTAFDPRPRSVDGSRELSPVKDTAKQTVDFRRFIEPTLGVVGGVDPTDESES